MSFNPQMHGNTASRFNSFTMDSSSASMMYDISEETAVKIATLQAKLNKKLGPEFISQRPGPGGGPKLTYAEGWKVINLANEVFGFNGWSTSIVNMTTDYVDFSEETRRYCVGVTAIIRVTLRDGVFHEDVGYGMLENSKSKGAALDKCKKEAVTDGVKRALRNFGNLLGNCLYDKEYTKEIVKVKVQPVKFDKDSLHRRPEFDESKPNIDNVSTSTLVTSNNTSSSRSAASTSTSHVIKREPIPPSHNKPKSAVPPHLKPVSSSTPNGKGKEPQNARFTFDLPSNATSPNACQQTTRTESTLKLGNQLQHQVIDSPGPDPALVTPSRSPLNPQPAPPPPIEPDADMDDAYHFPSEDDAFLADLDFAELDADLGRPIAYDDDDDGPASVNMGSTSGSGSSGTRQKQGDAIGNSDQSRVSHPPASHNISTSSSVTATSVSGHQLVQNKNLPLGGQLKSTSRGPETQQTPKHPVGGFNFPPGLNPQTRRPSPRPPQFSSGAGCQRTSGPAGIKRPADALQPAAPRRVSQGMGLSNGPAPGSSGRREPLTSLYVDPAVSGGPDLKRMKR